MSDIAADGAFSRLFGKFSREGWDLFRVSDI